MIQILIFEYTTALRLVNPETNQLSFQVPKTLEKGQIYQGGNISILEKWMGVRGHEILYFGDHLYSDVIKSKKQNGWRTFVVVHECTSTLFPQFYETK